MNKFLKAFIAVFILSCPVWSQKGFAMNGQHLRALDDGHTLQLVHAGFLLHAQSLATSSGTDLVANARMALFSRSDFKSVRIEGVVHSIAGSSKDSGSVVMTADVSGASTFELRLGSSSRLEKQSTTKAGRICTWSESDGKIHYTKPFNCWTATTWFFPHLALQSSLQTPSIRIVELQQDVKGASNTRILRHQVILAPNANNSKISDLISIWSKADVGLDSTTLLPQQLNYVIHPDSDSNKDIGVEIRFSEYRSVSGVEVPFRIQKLVNGSLQLDIEVAQVTLQ